jgi:Uma2 family endonuclease
VSIISTVTMPVAPNGLANGFPAASLYRLSVEQYHDMIRKGILKDGDPVEMVEGVLVKKMTKNPPHTFATQALRDLLPALLPSGWFVNDQEPVTTEDSQPEPDVAVIRGERRHFLVERRHPGPQDTTLVIEVADSSLDFDQTTKLRAYARSRIPVYWIVNLVDRRVQVYTDPTGPAVDPPTYQQRQDFGPADEVPVVLDGHEVTHIAVRDLLL